MRSPWKIPCATPASGAWSLWTMSHPTQIKDEGEEENQKFSGGLRGADGAKGRNEIHEGIKKCEGVK